ncbi:M14 family metallopeptidase [Chitinimonas sp.]|uniref:M14 family metallopeptidase n=1 Tax=Chitinimonas sp. TaxID=1934313 RepID=UPI002F9422AF
MPRHLPTLLLAACVATALAQPLTTLAERSGFKETGRYSEVQQLCNDFQAAYPKAVRCITFGQTPEGRPMQALVVSQSGALTPQAAQARRLPVLLVQGGIHAGEIDGKDAGFLALREALQGKAAKGALTKQVLLFVPVFNIDGHERFGAWNRPNQRGPEQMGWRTTGRNYNLNRDYAKADTAEMQAMLRLVDAWDPLAYIDLHVTDGAKFEHDISIMTEPRQSGDEALRQAGRALNNAVVADLTKQGSLPLDFYPSFAVEDDPSSGVYASVPPPRFSNGYFQLRNRLGMLVETHSWKDYPTRVRITRNTIVSLMEQIAAHGAEWRREAAAADARSRQLAGQLVALSYEPTDKVETIAFRGYAYTRTQSDVSGALMTRYDESRPQVWAMPLHPELKPELVVTAPKAGYVVPRAHAAWVAAKLALHGIQYQTLKQAATTEVEAFRASKMEFAAKSEESHQRLTLEGQWQPEKRALAAGDLYVPIAQPKARFVMALLEPQAPDALAAWGYFNTAFEPKEYMEPYVAEEVARQQLADPAIKAAFEAKLKDPAFAKDAAARLEFFARRHASWDERYQLYPVLRVATAPR